MKVRRIVTALGLLGIVAATSAYSAIKEGELISYFDDSGVLVGTDQHGCNSQRQVWGVRTENYTIENWSCGYPPYHPPGPTPPSCGGPGEFSC